MYINDERNNERNKDAEVFVKELRESFIKVRLRAKVIVNKLRDSRLFTCFLEYDDARFSKLIESEMANTDLFLEDLKRTRESALVLIDAIDELAEKILSRT